MIPRRNKHLWYFINSRDDWEHYYNVKIFYYIAAILSQI